MIFERQKSNFKQPGWTRVQITYARFGYNTRKSISDWVKSSYPESRYYYSYHANAYWFENPKAVTELILKFADSIETVKQIEDTTYCPVEKCQGQPSIPDLFQP